jgi:hypothetical protein
MHPNWIYNLITAIEEWEDIHSGAHDESVDQRMAACFDAELNKIPQEVRRTARAIAEYRRNQYREGSNGQAARGFDSG